MLSFRQAPPLVFAFCLPVQDLSRLIPCGGGPPPPSGGKALAMTKAAPRVVDTAPGFRQGDANGRGSVDLADGVSTLAALFQSFEVSSCRDAEDSDDDGQLDLCDAT